MILHVGQRVYWGAPEVIYLEGTIRALREETQTVVLHIERTTPSSAHLIDTNVTFAADGIRPLLGSSPPGTTSTREAQSQLLPPVSDDEKVRRAAASLVHQQAGYTLPAEREQQLIDLVEQSINSDTQMRQRIIDSMNEILHRKVEPEK